MKLRILNDSIRLRLSRDEVGELEAGLPVICQTHFPNAGAFTYRLETGGAEVTAAMCEQTLQVKLPKAAIEKWATDDSEVSISGSCAAGVHSLAILVEKDFECLDPRDGESQSNRFPNPKK